MVRNSVDHGLESPELRCASGKDPSGKIVLKTFHDSGSFVIEISDDGADGLLEMKWENALTIAQDEASCVKPFFAELRKKFPHCPRFL
jgi:hypothetical protein